MSPNSLLHNANIYRAGHLATKNLDVPRMIAMFGVTHVVEYKGTELPWLSVCMSVHVLV